eukprot:g828.t1
MSDAAAAPDPKLSRAASQEFIDGYFGTIFDSSSKTVSSSSSSSSSAAAAFDGNGDAQEAQEQDDNLLLRTVSVDAAAEGGDGGEAKGEQGAAVNEALEKLWTTFDDDGNGFLSNEECEQLMAAYLGSIQAKAADLASEHLASKVRKALQVHQENADDGLTDDDITGIIEEVVEDAKDVRDGVAKLYQKIGEDKEMLAKKSLDLMQMMDKDGDGAVSKEEFMSTFSLVLDKIIPAQQIDEYIGPQLMVELRGLNGRVKRYKARGRGSKSSGGGGILCGGRDGEDTCVLL